jgi:phenylalanine ammonia-lyase
MGQGTVLLRAWKEVLSMLLSKMSVLSKPACRKQKLSTVSQCFPLRETCLLGWTDLSNMKGVNTGFGGSADTRTKAVEELQRELMRGLHYGVLAKHSALNIDKAELLAQDIVALLAETSLPLDNPEVATCMPEAWVRASMLIRLNSLASGASGVKLSTVESLRSLIEKDIVPRIPLRGSISASGDLSPLSYIGGVMQGKPTLEAWIGDRSVGQRRLVRADVALAEFSIEPVKFGAKEGLAIVNGTAISAGVGALAMHEAMLQTALAEILTAMTVEALCGTDESFDPFFAKVRPHPGQDEAARDIYAFLSQSKLVFRSDGSDESSLRQDRYSIRTASQWMGPVLEDLLLAHQQVTIELNSVTDNPLVDTKGERVLHGGNFQAKSITSAMEKTRQACETMGRMLSVQCTELINPATSRGLPPNLVIDEPSESFIWKGTDIMVAALQSELGFLANTVANHVQSAEMGNQALNSLALISGRYTLDAIDVLSQMAAAHLLALCQALDIRALNHRFLETLQPQLEDLIQKIFAKLLRDPEKLQTLQCLLWESLKSRLAQSTAMDTAKRFQFASESLQPIILRFLSPSVDALDGLASWTECSSQLLLETFHTTREQYINQPDATPLLGSASCKMYRFVRERLSIPFVQEDTIRTPEPEREDLKDASASGKSIDPPTIGSLITRIYLSMRTGGLYSQVVECLKVVPQDPGMLNQNGVSV